MPEPDPAKVLPGLTAPMVRALTWWTWKGSLLREVPTATKKALVERGLAEWFPAGNQWCPRLTPLGVEVQALAKQAPERTDTPNA